MFKLGFMLGLGAGVMLSMAANAKKKSNMIDQGKQAIKEKLIKVFE
ncbi:MAG: hypothetical protein K2N57_00150 [Clostridia bacterium]|nr:hypothetical protein [Clostridia bacterium]